MSEVERYGCDCNLPPAEMSDARQESPDSRGICSENERSGEVWEAFPHPPRGGCSLSVRHGNYAVQRNDRWPSGSPWPISPSLSTRRARQLRPVSAQRRISSMTLDDVKVERCWPHLGCTRLVRSPAVECTAEAWNWSPGSSPAELATCDREGPRARFHCRTTPNLDNEALAPLPTREDPVAV